jgi:hypothetical protein
LDKNNCSSKKLQVDLVAVILEQLLFVKESLWATSLKVVGKDSEILIQTMILHLNARVQVSLAMTGTLFVPQWKEAPQAPVETTRHQIRGAEAGHQTEPPVIVLEETQVL